MYGADWTGGLIATGGGRMRSHRDLIVTLAARHKLPAVYNARFFVTEGGLIAGWLHDQPNRAAPQYAVGVRTPSGSANVTPFNGKAELYLGLERQPLQNRRP
jgi:hypothetical protein